MHWKIFLILFLFFLHNILPWPLPNEPAELIEAKLGKLEYTTN